MTILNEKLLEEYVRKHNEYKCDCKEENMELCLGGNYVNGNISKEEIFEDWK